MHPHDGGCFDTLNLLHLSICEITTFCDVLHETKNKMQTKSRECAAGDHLRAQLHLTHLKLNLCFRPRFIHKCNGCLLFTAIYFNSRDYFTKIVIVESK